MWVLILIISFNNQSISTQNIGGYPTENMCMEIGKNMTQDIADLRQQGIKASFICPQVE